MHPWLHSFAKRDESHTPRRENPKAAWMWSATWRCGLAQSVKVTAPSHSAHAPGRTAAADRIGTGLGHGRALRGDRDHLRRRPVCGGIGVAGHRAHGAAGLPLPAAGADRRDRCRRGDRLSDRGAGRFHDRRPLRLHRRADRDRQTQGPRHAHGDRLVADRRVAFGAASIGRADRDDPAAAPDLQGDDRERRRGRGIHGPDPHAGRRRRV